MQFYRDNAELVSFCSVANHAMCPSWELWTCVLLRALDDDLLILTCQLWMTFLHMYGKAGFCLSDCSSSGWLCVHGVAQGLLATNHNQPSWPPCFPVSTFIITPAIVALLKAPHLAELKADIRSESLGGHTGPSCHNYTTSVSLISETQVSYIENHTKLRHDYWIYVSFELILGSINVNILKLVHETNQAQCFSSTLAKNKAQENDWDN